MGDTFGIRIPGIDSLHELTTTEDNANNDGYIHIRVQQRNGRKCITSVQGLDEGFDKKKILKDLKKGLCCNGCVAKDDKAGCVLQLQGDQRKSVWQFLAEKGIAKKELIKLHGF